MPKSPGNQELDGRAAEAARQQLLRSEMRFVLQQDVRRFTNQLQARLLDEGCNLHPDLARNMFYEQFEGRLASSLTADNCDRLGEMTPGSDADATHPRFHTAVKFFAARLPDAETQITTTVLDVIEALKLEWHQMASKCFSPANPEATDLPALIEQISRVSPAGQLADHGLAEIHRRLKIAVVTSLLRHVRKPELLREKYGGIPLILQDLSRNPALLAALMVTLKEQVPYARQVIARSFWRTLNNLDTELPE